MKKQIIDALKTKFEGVSEAILGRVAAKLISSGKVTKAEDVATAVEGVTFQQVLESYGDSRADEAQQTAVKNYESKHNLKDGKPVDGGTGNEPPQQQEPPQGGQQQQQTTTKTEEMPAWAKAFMTELETVKQGLTNIKTERTANSRQTKLTEVLKKAPESVRSRYEKDFARMTFKDDTEFDEWITELTPDIDKMETDFASRGGVVGRPKGAAGSQQGKEDINPLLQERIKEREAVTPTPAIQGLATNTQ